MANPILSVVIPVYNEGEGLYLLLKRLQPALRELGVPWEVILVDDHSADNTPEVLREICRQDGFEFLRLARNSGSHVAILAGLEACRGECALFMAADLQDPPELIGQLLQLWREGYQTIWAVRSGREGISHINRAISRSYYWLLTHVGGIAVPPDGSDFAMIDRCIIEALRQSVGAHPSLFLEIAKIGFRQTEVPYIKEARKFGETKWRLKTKLKAFADAFVSSSFAPMRIMSYLGLSLSVLGFLYALYILVMRILVEKTVPGFASLMVVVLTIGGVQMIMLGVLGEYLWRTLEESRRRPVYFIEQNSQTESIREKS